MDATTQDQKPKSTVGSQLLLMLRKNTQTYTILLALAAIWIIFSISTNGLYLSPQNISNLFRQMSVTALLATGMVLVIVTGNIDLSVGKLAGYVSVFAAYLQARIWTQHFPDQPFLAAMLSVVVGLVVGAFAGTVQGYIISYLNIPSFIVTLAGMWMFNGLILLRTEGKTIPANQPVFSAIGQGYIPKSWGWAILALAVIFILWNLFRSRQNKRKHGFELTPLYIDLISAFLPALVLFVYIDSVNTYKGVPIPVVLLAIVAIIMTYVTNNTRFGRYSYAIGGNKEAARLSGININMMKFQIFILMGFLCGVAGVVLASYVGYGTIAAGGGYELDAIASCILGGTSTLGGIGTIPGAMIGSLIIASLTTGLQMMNVAPAWQYVFKAAVLVLAVLADVYFKKK
jgi:D-xylose transport system permease protein